MPKMKVKKRQPATFELSYLSSVFKTTVKWKTIVSDKGVTARRDSDGMTVSIPWEKLIGMAMFYGSNSKSGGNITL